MEKISQIFDRIFKRIFSLSNLTVINLLNGLFQLDLPPDSTVICTNTEFISRTLDRRMADILLTINRKHTFHIEAQMYMDSTMVLRVCEYGFLQAMRHDNPVGVLCFPNPIVIYFGETGNIPPQSQLVLDFGSQGSFTYTVKNYIYLEHDLQELNRKKMAALIPFQLLRPRRDLTKNPSKENIISLKKLLENDIINNIEEHLKEGNITPDDADQLLEMTGMLYDGLYSGLNLGGEDMKPLLEGAIELPLDKYRRRIDELEEQLAKAEGRQVEVEKLQAELDKRQAEADKRQAELEKLQAETEKRQAEADKRQAELEKLQAEADKLQAELTARIRELEKLIKKEN